MPPLPPGVVRVALPVAIEARLSANVFFFSSFVFVSVARGVLLPGNFQTPDSTTGPSPRSGEIIHEIVDVLLGVEAPLVVSSSYRPWVYKYVLGSE